MKKLIVLLLTVLLSFPLFSQEEKRELSDYEKYRMEQESGLEQTDDEVFYIVEDMPKFNGEDAKEFRKWIALNVEYPKNAIENGVEGKVIVSFVVDKKGDVTNVKVEKGVDYDLDKAACQVVSKSPKWTPGKQRGKAVKVQFTFPINFVLDSDVAKEEQYVINNYYFDNQPDYRRSLYFGYSPGFYGYNYYDPYYYGYGYNPYYYGSYYSYWRYNTYYNPYYHPHSHYTYYNKPNGRLYARSGSLGSNRNYYTPYNKTYSSGYVNRPTAMKKTTPVRQSTTRQSTSTNSYTPKYNKPRMATRPEYNSTTTRARPSMTTRPQSKSVQQRSTYVRPAQSTTRSSSSYSRPSTPSRSSSSYSRPSSTSRSSYSRPSSTSRSSYSGSSSGSSVTRSSGSRSGGKK